MGEVDFNPPEGIFRLASSVRGTFSLSSRVPRADIPLHYMVTFISIQFSRIKIITISPQDPPRHLYYCLDRSTVPFHDNGQRTILNNALDLLFYYND